METQSNIIENDALILYFIRSPLKSFSERKFKVVLNHWLM